MMTITSREENSIEQSRIVTNHELPSEYFCPVCQCLLWKPVSCSTCQQLFCRTCIQLWSQNTDGVKKCPFRCQPFEERRCPPYFQTLLSRIQIRCRNASFGCNEILSYDTLEHHESVNCKFLTRACGECQQLVLVGKIFEHENTLGACAPLPIKCVICEQHIQKSLFREHFDCCYQERANELWARARWRQNLQGITQGAQQVPNDIQVFLQANIEATQLFEQQRNFSRLPTKLKGLDDVLESRQGQYGYSYRIYATLKFILLNWSRSPFLILHLAIAGLIKWIVLLGLLFFVLLERISTRCGSKRIVLFSLIGLLQFVTFICLQRFSDKYLMISLVTFITVEGCSIPLVFEQLEAHPTFNKPWFTVFNCGVNLLFMKLGFLLLRFYFWCISIYSAIGFCVLLTIYVYYKHAKARRPFLQTTPSFGLNIPL